MPGLLQTRGYAQTIFTARRPFLDEETIEQRARRFGAECSPLTQMAVESRSEHPQREPGTCAQVPRHGGYLVSKQGRSATDADRLLT
ncbi:hypothetical protein [Streptomyces sp. NPDC056337]|uniref:hypothetical protein n=1 Tax=Streptomyces sp. NPDC056337 TaxID=3345787 RepID=UPI0035D70719